MNEKWINKAIAAVFLVVGILAVFSTARLHTYINETLPRDQAQEKCQEETLGVLRSWVSARFLRDETADTAADATIVVLDRLIAGQQATPDELSRWRDAVAADNHARMQDTQMFHNLPNC